MSMRKIREELRLTHELGLRAATKRFRSSPELIAYCCAPHADAIDLQQKEKQMTKDNIFFPVDRRTVIKAAALAGAAPIASPFVITARAADEIRIGLDNPLTGTYAALGKNELIGAQLALEQINAKGGILGRKAELLVEDFDQRRRRHRRAEGTQADRPRPGELPGRQHQLRARPGNRERGFREEACSTSYRAATLTPSPARIAIGMFSASATRRRWKRTPSPTH